MKIVTKLLLALILALTFVTQAQALLHTQSVKAKVIDDYFDPGIEFTFKDSLLLSYGPNNVYLYRNNCTFASGKLASAYRFCLRLTPPGKSCQDQDGIYRASITEDGVQTCQAKVNILTDNLPTATKKKGNATSVDLIESGPNKGKRIPRVQMCLYEDPMDGTDTTASRMIHHRHTETSAPVVLGWTKKLVSDLLFTNHVVVDVVGCWDVPLPKGPPPYCDQYAGTVLEPYIAGICTKNTSFQDQTCVHRNPKFYANDEETYSTFRNPKIRLTSNYLISSCTNADHTLNGYCVKIYGLADYPYAEAEQCSNSAEENNSNCITSTELQRSPTLQPKFRYEETPVEQDSSNSSSRIPTKIGIDIGHHIDVGINQCKNLCLDDKTDNCQNTLSYQGKAENNQLCVYKCNDQCSDNQCNNLGALVKCIDRPSMPIPEVSCTSRTITGGDGEYYYKTNEDGNFTQCYVKIRGTTYLDTQCTYAKQQLQDWETETTCQTGEPELLVSTDITQCYYHEDHKTNTGKKIICDPVHRKDGQVCEPTRDFPGCGKRIHKCNIRGHMVTHQNKCDIDACYNNMQRQCQRLGHYPCNQDHFICLKDKRQEWKTFTTGVLVIDINHFSGGRFDCTYDRTVYYAMDTHYFTHKFFAPNDINSAIDTTAEENDESLFIIPEGNVTFDSSFKKISNVWFKLSVSEKNGICESKHAHIRMFDNAAYIRGENAQWNKFHLGFSMKRHAFDNNSLEVPLTYNKKLKNIHEYLCLEGVPSKSLSYVIQIPTQDSTPGTILSSRQNYNHGDTIIYDACIDNPNPKLCTQKQRKQYIAKYITQYYPSISETDKTKLLEDVIPTLILTGYEQLRSKNLKESGLCVRVPRRR